MKATALTRIALLAALAAVPGMSECQIRGSAQPEAIPDEIAYRMVLNTLLPGSKETPDGHHRRVNAYLGLIGLERGDRDLFHSVLKIYAAQASTYEEQLKVAVRALQANQQASTEARALFNQRLALVPQAQASLVASLSPAGGAALAKHIREYVKPRTVMPCPK